MIKRKVIIPKKFFDVIQNELNNNIPTSLTDKKHDTITVFSVKFNNYYEADVKICTDSENKLFIDVVLFFKNTEVCCLDVIYELLDEDEYVFYENDKHEEFVIVVKKGE